MIVVFVSGPAAGVFKNMEDKPMYRIGTERLLAEGQAAFYQVENAEYHDVLRRKVASAVFLGVKDSAASLVDLVVEEYPED